MLKNIGKLRFDGIAVALLGVAFVGAAAALVLYFRFESLSANRMLEVQSSMPGTTNVSSSVTEDAN